MALPLPAGLTHAEVLFLAENETITIVPRTRLDAIELLGGTTPALRPPRRAEVPLWLALLLKKQRRANIVAPPWLHPASLNELIRRETKDDLHAFSSPPPNPARADSRRPGFARRPYDDNDEMALSPPFQPSCTAAAPAGYLPYHWLEVAESLLAHAGDDVAGASEVRGLLRDLAEARAAKMRGSGPGGAGALEGFGGGGLVNLRGVGALELAESRAFVLGVVDGVRRIGASAETTRRDEEEELVGRAEDEGESDEDMGF